MSGIFSSTPKPSASKRRSTSSTASARSKRSRRTFDSQATSFAGGDETTTAAVVSRADTTVLLNSTISQYPPPTENVNDEWFSPPVGVSPGSATSHGLLGPLEVVAARDVDPDASPEDINKIVEATLKHLDRLLQSVDAELPPYGVLVGMTNHLRRAMGKQPMLMRPDTEMELFRTLPTYTGMKESTVPDDYGTQLLVNASKPGPSAAMYLLNRMGIPHYRGYTSLGNAYTHSIKTAEPARVSRDGMPYQAVVGSRRGPRSDRFGGNIFEPTDVVTAATGRRPPGGFDSSSFFSEIGILDGSSISSLGHDLLDQSRLTVDHDQEDVTVEPSLAQTLLGIGEAPCASQLTYIVEREISRREEAEREKVPTPIRAPENSATVVPYSQRSKDVAVELVPRSGHIKVFGYDRTTGENVGALRESQYKHYVAGRHTDPMSGQPIVPSSELVAISNRGFEACPGGLFWMGIVRRLGLTPKNNATRAMVPTKSKYKSVKNIVLQPTIVPVVYRNDQGSLVAIEGVYALNPEAWSTLKAMGAPDAADDGFTEHHQILFQALMTDTYLRNLIFAWQINNQSAVNALGSALIELEGWTDYPSGNIAPNILAKFLPKAKKILGMK